MLHCIVRVLRYGSAEGDMGLASPRRPPAPAQRRGHTPQCMCLAASSQASQDNVYGLRIPGRPGAWCPTSGLHDCPPGCTHTVLMNSLRGGGCHQRRGTRHVLVGLSQSPIADSSGNNHQCEGQSSRREMEQQARLHALASGIFLQTRALMRLS